MKIWSNKSSKIASVLPISWFSKFKTKGNDSEISSVNKERLDFPTPNGKIYNMHEDDAYWSLSFRKDDRVEGRRSTGGINSLSSYIDRIDEVQVPVGGQNRNFDDMVLDFKKLKEKQHKERISRKNDEGDRVIFAIEPEDTVKNGAKYKDIRVKTESYGKKVRKNNGAKSYSPRTECKIKAIEEMRKAKMKKKKLPKEQGKTVFDSFAVVKSSVNPHRDFRDSMVEMIIEKGIRRPRELEKLLACYLELNSDEYHHLIIKVFRQVWFDLNGMYADHVMHE